MYEETPLLFISDVVPVFLWKLIVRDTNRVEEVIKKLRGKAVEYGASPDFVEALYREMIRRIVI